MINYYKRFRKLCKVTMQSYCIRIQTINFVSNVHTRGIRRIRGKHLNDSILNNKSRRARLGLKIKSLYLDKFILDRDSNYNDLFSVSKNGKNGKGIYNLRVKTIIDIYNSDNIFSSNFNKMVENVNRDLYNNCIIRSKNNE